MDRIKKRQEELNEYAYFKEKPGLAEAIAKVEWKTGIKIPTTFNEIIMPTYQYGEVVIQLGKIGPYFTLSFRNKESGLYHEAFDTKQALKLFFTKSDIDQTVQAFFLREIDEITNVR